MSDEYPSFDDYEREAEEQLCGQPTMTASHRKAATMSDDRVEMVARAICWAMAEETDDCSIKCLNANRCMADEVQDCFKRDARAALSTLDPSIESLQAEVERALDHYDCRSALYTNDADLAAGMAAILRQALAAKEQTR